MTTDEALYEARLHRISDGEYRVGASLFVIIRHGSDWGVYTRSVEGLLRVPGEWSFRLLRDARKRAFALAEEFYA